MKSTERWDPLAYKESLFHAMIHDAIDGWLIPQAFATEPSHSTALAFLLLFTDGGKQRWLNRFESHPLSRTDIAISRQPSRMTVQGSLV